MMWKGGEFEKREAAMKNKRGGDDDARDEAWRVDQSCMDIFKSCMKNHGYTTMTRYVRKSSSMTLNEALCGRQPIFFCLDIY
jgi:hypothetical protein